MARDPDATITTTTADVQERLSLAYLTAVAAQAGCQVQEFKVDRNGVDATIRPIAGASIAVDVQMKSVTTNVRIDGGKALSYQLDRRTYDKLRRTDVQVPQLFVLLEMPKERESWLEVTPPLVLRNAAYWRDLWGLPGVDTASTAVHIDAANVLDDKAIVAILEQAHAMARVGRSWR